ncbi:MAG: hypothetical protein DSZ10_04620, partial [Sulfurovum sp.]
YDLDNPSCQSSQVIGIGTNDGPSVTDIITTPATCGQANGTVAIYPNTYQYTWLFDGSTCSCRTDLEAGTYIVQVVDPATPNCPNFITVTIDEISNLEATAQVNNQPTAGNTDGSVTITVENGSGDYTFNWGSFETTDATVTNLAAGQYTVIITDNDSGCHTTVEVELTSGSSSGATISVNDVSVNCYGESNATADYTVTYDAGFVQPATVNIIDANGAIQTDGALAAGHYCIVVLDGNGDEAAQSCFDVTQPEALNATANYTPDTDEIPGGLFVTVSGGTEPYTFDWADLDGDDNPQNR